MPPDAAARRRATKLICTLGPATADRVDELVGAGMDVARINLSHGSRDDHDRMLAAVREAASAAGRAVGVMTDLSGPKVRLGELADGEAALAEGAAFVLRPDGPPGDASGAATTHPGLADDLSEGDRVLLSDGAVELRVEAATGGEVRTRVMRGGVVRSRAGVNVPAERLSLPPITPKDQADLAWARDANVDVVAQSFVRSAEDVHRLERLLGDAPALVMAKLETGAAVAEADAILEAADAVMVARGDLGVEMRPEEIPVIQKDLLARAIRTGTPAVVATQMLESMTRSRRPTRAEASDVAGAVFDGASGILLSAETAIGDHPMEAARTAARIAEVAETEGRRFLSPAVEEESGGSDARAVAHAAAAAAREAGAAAVACFTRSGRTAKLLSAVRLPVPIYAFSADERVVRRLTIFRGIVPSISDLPEHTEAMIRMMDARLRGGGVVAEGDLVVMVASTPVGRSHTNLLKVHRVGGPT